MNDLERRTRDMIVGAVDTIPVPAGPGGLAPRARTPVSAFATFGVAAALVIALAIAVGVARNNTVVPAGTPSPTPSGRASAGVVPFPDLPLAVGTDTGDVYTRLANGQPGGTKIHVCDGIIEELVTSGRLVLARSACGGKPSDTAWYLWDTSTTTVTRLVTSGPLGAAFTGAGSIVYVATGTIEPSAPIPMTKLVLRDLATGKDTQIDERYVVANDLRLTGEGVTVWRAKNNPSMVRTDAEAGTWILRGMALVKFSQNRLIASVNGLGALESEPTDVSAGCCSVVYTKAGSGPEQRLTPANVPDEHVLAVLEDGRIVTWRTDGHVVIYAGGAPTRVDAGSFSSWRVVRSGDWLISESPDLNPSLLAYRISDGAFARLPITPATVHALAPLSTP